LSKSTAAVSVWLDHVGYLGAELTELIRCARRLGLMPTEPEALQSRNNATGNVDSLQQQSCHVVMPASYLELTAVASEDPAHHLAAWRSRGMGAHILALGAVDIEGVWRQCALAGLRPTAIVQASRPIRYGTTHGDAEFDWFMLPATVFSAALLCVVRHRTPALVYQTEVMAHPLRAVALEEVSIIVSNPARTLAKQLSWLGEADLIQEDGCEIPLQLGRLSLLTASAAGMRWGERFAGPRWAGGGLAAVALRVADLALAQKYLQSAGVAVTRVGDELRIHAHDANGAVLALRG
jgi:hypothetical protein